jgi:hypothetical protein
VSLRRNFQRPQISILNPSIAEVPSVNSSKDYLGDAEMAKDDPVGTKYYSPLVLAERISRLFFWSAAVLSILALLVEKETRPDLYGLVQITFAVSVVGTFLSGLAIRLYWSSRAQEKRISDFVSDAFDVSLIPERSHGYFNNAETEPFRRIAASLLENTLFTKGILQRMLRNERIKVALYALIWFLALLYRATDLALITGTAQVVLSEQIISRWVRMEWLRGRAEGIHGDVYILIQTAKASGSKEFKARAIECLLRYETSKSQAGISISSMLFKSMNSSLSQEWQKTASILKL